MANVAFGRQFEETHAKSPNVTAHRLRSVLEVAEEELRHHVPGAAMGLDFWGKASSEEARLRWLEKYALVLERALAATEFVPLPMPDARSPPDGELLLAWAMHRTGAPLAVFPQCAKVENGVTTLGATGSSTTCAVYRGPLRLEGSVRCTGTVVVLGDLIVDGRLTDGWASDSALVVIGNEQVRVMVAAGDHIVTGNLTAELLHVASEESSVVCGGELNAKAVISEHWSPGEGHPFVVRPDALTALLERLEPRPETNVELDTLLDGLASGTFRLR